MSRSRRKTPIFPVCRPTGVKQWKKEYNRLMRRVPVDAEPPKKNEHGDEWMGPRDGKYYDNNPEDKRMRK